MADCVKLRRRAVSVKLPVYERTEGKQLTTIERFVH